MRKGKEMKKKSIIIASVFAILFTLANTTSVHAQGGIFIMDEEEENFRDPTAPAGGFIFIDDPEHDTTWDYSPIGSGVWLLGGLAGAYLLGKRRKKKEE